MFKIALASVLHDRRRYTPIAIVVAIAGLMLLAQIAVAMGVFRDAAAPVARSGADLWAGPAGVASLTAGGTLAPSQVSALWLIPELARIEPYATRFGTLTRRPQAEDAAVWDQDATPTRFVSLLALQTDAGAMLYARHLPAPMRQALAEPGTIVIGTEDAAALNTRPGDRVFLDNRAVRVVGVLPGLRGLGMSTALVGPSTLTADASDSTEAAPGQSPAFWLIGLTPGTTPDRAAEIARAASAASGIALWQPDALRDATVRDFALTSGAGTIFLSSAVVAMVVAALVVNQTMSATIAGSIREYAALRAFGLGLGRLVVLVLMQGALVTVASVALLLGLTQGLLALLAWGQIPHALPFGIGAVAIGGIVAVVLLSNLIALRRLRAADPAALLR